MLVAGGFGLLYFGVFDCCLLCRRFWCLGCNGLCFGFVVSLGVLVCLLRVVFCVMRIGFKLFV